MHCYYRYCLYPWTVPLCNAMPSTLKSLGVYRVELPKKNIPVLHGQFNCNYLNIYSQSVHTYLNIHGITISQILLESRRPQLSNDVYHSTSCIQHSTGNLIIYIFCYFGKYGKTQFPAKMVSMAIKIMWHFKYIIVGQYTNHDEDWAAIDQKTSQKLLY